MLPVSDQVWSVFLSVSPRLGGARFTRDVGTPLPFVPFRYCWPPRHAVLGDDVPPCGESLHRFEPLTQGSWWTPWRRFLTPARCGQTTSRIARPNSDDDGSGSPSLRDVTCASGTQLHVGAGERRVVTIGSAASNDARWVRRIGAASRTDRVGSTRLRRTVGVRPHRSRWTQGGSRGRKGWEARAGTRNRTAHCRLRLRQP